MTEFIIKKCSICCNNFKTEKTKRGIERKTCSKSCASKLAINNSIIESTCILCNNQCKVPKHVVSSGLNRYCEKCKFLKKENICNLCGEKFRSNRKDVLFCSDKCRLNFRRNKLIDVNCDFCGKYFKKATFNVYKNKRNYCSKRCLNNHYSILRPTRYGGTYTTFRIRILKRDNYMCQCCGSKENIQVHHFNKVKNFNNPNNAHFDENAI